MKGFVMNIYDYTLILLVSLLIAARVAASWQQYKQTQGIQESWYQNQDTSEKSTGYRP